MNIEAAFKGAREGNAAAIAAMKMAAEVGDKGSEELLIKLIREYQADNGEENFAVAFKRVALANPDLHRAYLNANR